MMKKSIIPILALLFLALSAPAQDKLNNKVARRVLKINSTLNSVDKAVQAQNLKQAKMYLGGAEKEMAKIFSWYKGKFDETHPDFVKVTARLKKSVAAVNGDGGLATQADSLKGELGAVIGALTLAKSQLTESLTELKANMLKFEAATEGRNGQNPAVSTASTEVMASLDRCLTVHEVASKTAAQFRLQFPNIETLKKLTKQGFDAEDALLYIEGYSQRLNTAREWGLTRTQRNGAESLASAKKALARDSKKQDIVKIAVQRANGTCAYLQDVHTYIEALVGPKAGRSKSIEASAKQNDSLKDGISAIMVDAARISKKSADAKMLALSLKRFPSTAYEGKQWQADTAAMAKCFELYTKNKKAYRTRVHSPWDKRTEARWINDKWVVGTYKYLGGTVLGKLQDGRYRVYRISFRRTQQQDGNFGPLETFGIGHSFEILAENIDK